MPTSSSVSTVSRTPGAVMTKLRRHPDSSSRAKTWPGRLEGRQRADRQTSYKKANVSPATDLMPLPRRRIRRNRICRVIGMVRIL